MAHDRTINNIGFQISETLLHSCPLVHQFPPADRSLTHPYRNKSEMSERKIKFEFPSGLSFSLHTRVPGILSMRYKDNTPTTNASGPSEKISSAHNRDNHHRDQNWEQKADAATSNNGSAPIVIRMEVPPPPTLDPASPAPTEPASPTPTEPAECNYPEETQELASETLSRLNISSRDFAYEPWPQGVEKTPEVFQPAICFLYYREKLGLFAKEVRRLRSMGWLSSEEGADQVKPFNRRFLDPKFQLYPWRTIAQDDPRNTSYEEYMSQHRRKQNRLKVVGTGPGEFWLVELLDPNGEPEPNEMLDSKKPPMEPKDLYTYDFSKLGEILDEEKDENEQKEGKKRAREGKDEKNVPSSTPDEELTPTSKSKRPKHSTNISTPSSSQPQSSSSSNTHTPSSSPAQRKPRGLVRTETFVRF